MAFTSREVRGGTNCIKDWIKDTNRPCRESDGLRMVEHAAKANWDRWYSRQESACFTYHRLDSALGDLIYEADDMGREM